MTQNPEKVLKISKGYKLSQTRGIILLLKLILPQQNTRLLVKNLKYFLDTFEEEDTGK